MLKVTIELVSARTGVTSEIGRMYITNDGNASCEDPRLGDYLVAVCRRGTTEVPAPVDDRDDAPKATRAGAVKAYPRLAHNVWRLILRALTSAFPEERIGKRVGDAPVLDANVMSGMQSIADIMVGSGSPLSVSEQAAIDWVNAGKRDDQ